MAGTRGERDVREERDGNMRGLPGLQPKGTAPALGASRGDPVGSGVAGTLFPAKAAATTLQALAGVAWFCPVGTRFSPPLNKSSRK